jgi:hypothetical protein
VTSLTPAQLRLLRFLAVDSGWHYTGELERTKLLELDDIVVLPSLVELGLARTVPLRVHNTTPFIVVNKLFLCCLTPQGAAAVEQMRHV